MADINYLEMLKQRANRSDQSDERYSYPISAWSLLTKSSSYTVDVTPAMAIDWVSNLNYEKQRSVRDYHIDELATAMKNGRFRENSTIDFALCDRKIYLINGQHTLHAIAKSGITTSLNCLIHYCQNKQDIVDIYITFDRPLIRTPKDAISAYDIPGYSELRSDIQSSVYRSTFIVSSGFSFENSGRVNQRLYPWNYDRKVRADLISSWMPELKMISDDAITEPDKYRAIVSLNGFLAVALAVYRFAPDEARVFWRGIMMDDGLRRGDPRKAFIRMHQNSRASGINQGRVSSRVQAFYAAAAWNAYVSNRDVINLRLPTNTAYISINLTPHTGDRQMVYVDSDWNIHKRPFQFER